VNLKKQLVFVIFIACLIIIPLTLDYYNLESKFDKSTQNELLISKYSEKIFINGTSDWIEFRSSGNCSGSGIYSDPYIIEDLIIDGQNEGNGICIVNSDLFFRIENCTIFNCGNNFYNYDSGIQLSNVSNACIAQNIIYNNSYGILLYGNNNSIVQNNILDNQVGLIGAGKSIVSENNVTYNMCGIFGISDLNLTSNNVDYNEEYGILLSWGYNNSIMYNSVNYNNGKGIYLDDSYYNIISNNDCSNNRGNGIQLQGWIDPWGYPMRGSMYNVISENIVNNNLCGIMINITQENQILNNTINNNRNGGIEIYHSRDIQILNNRIKENRYGVKMVESLINDIIQNIINYNYYGISLISSDANDIIGNTLHYNRICYTETADCLSNNYENNDCIDLKDDPLNWFILLGIISVTSLLSIIFLLFRRKRT
jgi:parallel beta-helix repeat protein